MYTGPVKFPTDKESNLGPKRPMGRAFDPDREGPSDADVLRSAHTPDGCPRCDRRTRHGRCAVCDPTDAERASERNIAWATRAGVVLLCGLVAYFLIDQLIAILF